MAVNHAKDKGARGTTPVDQPPGNSAVEIAARKGFGPLSALANKVWHGDSRPCVSCGELVRRSDTRCESCGEQLSIEMIEKMRTYAGPWYVLEHVRPFPGVTCERLVRQIRRGVLTRMTIVRGPSTDHQWRFAGETPGLCKYLGVCWNCQAKVSIEKDLCPSCGVDLGELSDEIPGATMRTVRSVQSESTSSRAGSIEPVDIQELRRAVQSVPRQVALEYETPRIGRIKASWIAVAIVIVLISLLFAVVHARGTPIQRQQTSESASPVHLLSVVSHVDDVISGLRP